MDLGSLVRMLVLASESLVMSHIFRIPLAKSSFLIMIQDLGSIIDFFRFTDSLYSTFDYRSETL